MTAHKTLLLCSCDKSQTFDSEALRKAAGAEQAIAVDQLCGKELSVAAEHLGASNDVLIACGQQAALFERLAEDVHAEIQHAAPLQSIDIRDRAGWSAPDAKPERLHAKQAALIAAAQLPPPMAPAKTIQSNGVCCIVGPTEKAIRMAGLVQDELGVTCIVNDAGPIQLPSAAYDVAKGQLTGAYGALGNFKLEFAHLQPLHPAGRGELGYEAAKPTARSECDVFIDLRGGAPAFPSHEKRNGYFWADPEKSGELERIALTAREMVGEFEKTVYFRLEESLCAHSRANKPGCTRCLDVCPTEAIFSFGDHIQIDSDICAGCGSCAAVCPTSAVTMNETPFEAITKAVEVMAKVYREHTHESPRLVFHTLEAGTEAIANLARYDNGLADDLIPMGLEHVDRIGHAEIMAAFGAGYAEVLILADNELDRRAVTAEVELAQAMLKGTHNSPSRIRVISAIELCDAGDNAGRVSDPVLLVGGRRDITRVTVAAMSEKIEEPIPLPKGAPYGAIEIDSDKCTLCLACVSLCPTGALGDHPDRPEVQFTENACVQCGICESTCPETAITLKPQLDVSKAALSARALHGEEPFECIKCGTPFGVASTINRIVEKLENQHWMYKNSDNVQLIKMCDDCRVKAQFHGSTAPMAGGERPRVRTSDDYLDS
ncbi:4Fe-4S binding protein [Marinobacter adhaerens]|jgi:ferredoxin|uniref:4Fe-4S binding protein n=1 Tax=Marinobacter adhaerens TaxID=1033846 RepID=A0ABX8IM80_9GAMM|nr:4Fe-4S binding protein [Marinobacter adhaerens]MAI31921.1 ferredoxin [Rhodopirellula sp.]MBW3227288.1 4Fe-4S binding protein [Marinobacter adhaerens]MBW4978221.1 4Fe-4S binding protein [Marinobacter adhaerens]MCK5863604.1 4Fe-4S binding protein [Marinobacter adhaerens]QWV13764.1 4Fe-4S binding protein [Marinobacter adhaerens]